MNAIMSMKKKYKGSFDSVINFLIPVTILNEDQVPLQVQF